MLYFDSLLISSVPYYDVFHRLGDLTPNYPNAKPEICFDTTKPNDITISETGVSEIFKIAVACCVDDRFSEIYVDCDH